MTREVQVISWCDLHEPGVYVRGLEHTITLDGQTLEIDLCEEHETALGLDALAKALAEHGRPVGKTTARRSPPTAPAARAARAVASGRRMGRPPREGRRHDCPWCPLDYSAPDSLRKHIGAVHGIDARTLGDALGNECPACGHATPHLAAHALGEHGAGIGTVYRQALAAGDAHGVCKPLEKRARNVAR